MSDIKISLIILAEYIAILPFIMLVNKIKAYYVFLQWVSYIYKNNVTLHII